LDKNQNSEYDLVKNISENLIFDNYNRNTIFKRIAKTSIGFNIPRMFKIKQKKYWRWNIHININIDTNETIISSILSHVLRL